MIVDCIFEKDYVVKTDYDFVTNSDIIFDQYKYVYYDNYKFYNQLIKESMKQNALINVNENVDERFYRLIFGHFQNIEIKFNERYIHNFRILCSQMQYFEKNYKLNFGLYNFNRFCDQIIYNPFDLKKCNIKTNIIIDNIFDFHDDEKKKFLKNLEIIEKSNLNIEISFQCYFYNKDFIEFFKKLKGRPKVDSLDFIIATKEEYTKINNKLIIV